MAEENSVDEVKKSGALPTVVAFVVITVVAAGAAVGLAWLSGKEAKDLADASVGCTGQVLEAAKLEDTVSSVVELPSIITNLAGENPPWLRLDLSVVLPIGLPDKNAVVARLSDDFLGYVRSLTPGELSGGTNLYLLKRDLREIAKERTASSISDVLIRTIIVE